MLRQSKGTDLIWQRHLGAAGLQMDQEDPVETLEGVLRTVAAALVEQADDLARHPGA